MASVCRKKKQTTTGSPKNEQGNHIEQTTDSSEDDVEYTLYHVNSGSNQPLVVDVKLNGIAHPMEVDTGASVSLMSKESFQMMKESGVILNTTKAKLSTYTMKVIVVAGTADVTEEHNGQRVALSLIVTRGKGPSLLGRSLIVKTRLAADSDGKSETITLRCPG